MVLLQGQRNPQRTEKFLIGGGFMADKMSENRPLVLPVVGGCPKLAEERRNACPRPGDVVKLSYEDIREMQKRDGW